MPRARADPAPGAIEEARPGARQTGEKATLRGILENKDARDEERKASATLGQAADLQVWPGGRQREQRGEGEARALRHGPPAQFVAPNVAGAEQPSTLVAPN